MAEPHPWGPSHGEAYEPADIVAKLERAIDNLPEEKKAEAVAGIRKATEEKNALPGQILKGVLGTLIGIVK